MVGWCAQKHKKRYYDKFGWLYRLCGFKPCGKLQI